MALFSRPFAPLVLALGLFTVAGAEQSVLDERQEPAIAADDECLASDGPDCALNALQRRGAKVARATPAAPGAEENATEASAEVAADYEQCGGEGWSGASACRSGFYCAVVDQWYAQCMANGSKPAARGDDDDEDDSTSRRRHNGRRRRVHNRYSSPRIGPSVGSPTGAPSVPPPPASSASTAAASSMPAAPTVTEQPKPAAPTVTEQPMP
mmetsp:Transcript_15370/g.40778  ORF Transcript_15370/g.40778 Transcript_15370/m.40778 type:complete len:211 (-) Transcript_15370:56-688(-)